MHFSSPFRFIHVRESFFKVNVAQRYPDSKKRPNPRKRPCTAQFVVLSWGSNASGPQTLIRMGVFRCQRHLMARILGRKETCVSAFFASARRCFRTDRAVVIGPRGIFSRKDCRLLRMTSMWADMIALTLSWSRDCTRLLLTY